MTIPAIVPGSVPPPWPESAGAENSLLGPLDEEPSMMGPTWPIDRGSEQSGPRKKPKDILFNLIRENSILKQNYLSLYS